MKNKLEFRFIFSQTLKIKKTPNINFLYKKKEFKINIIRFNSLN